MFNVNVGGNDYSIEFKYEGRDTQCIMLNNTAIGDGDEDKILAYGHTATCSKQDQFNKNTGRKLALSRVLKTIPRGYRKRFWDAYFEARHGQY